jgi:hypothetical protein
MTLTWFSSRCGLRWQAKGQAALSHRNMGEFVQAAIEEKIARASAASRAAGERQKKNPGRRSGVHERPKPLRIVK